MKASDAKRILENRYRKQNEYIKNNYDRFTVTLPKGTKDKIKALTGKSMNGYINELVLADLKRLENRMEEE